jgi:parallel beta helix pectate lyase-like protein
MTALLVTIAITSALVNAQDAAAVTYTVHSERGFQATIRAAGPGDTIKLAKGTWPRMAISNRNFGAGKQLVITGSAGTISRGFEVAGSSGIKFVNLSFNGGAHHTIIESTYGNNITISTCAFTSADEFIHVHGGTTWMVERSSFGQNNIGSASVKFEPNRMLPQIRNVTIRNNLFNAPQGPGRTGVSIKAFRNLAKLPKNVLIVNNTIFGSKTGVVLPGGWDKWDRSLHPIIANNAMAEFAAPFNTRGRLFSNLAERGTVVPGVEIGRLHLNANLSPSASSKLVIDLADPLYAPGTDYFNRARVGSSDRGAIEYRGSSGRRSRVRRHGL